MNVICTLYSITIYDHIYKELQKYTHVRHNQGSENINYHITFICYSELISFVTCQMW